MAAGPTDSASVFVQRHELSHQDIVRSRFPGQLWRIGRTILLRIQSESLCLQGWWQCHYRYIWTYVWRSFLDCSEFSSLYWKAFLKCSNRIDCSNVPTGAGPKNSEHYLQSLLNSYYDGGHQNVDGVEVVRLHNAEKIIQGEFNRLAAQGNIQLSSSTNSIPDALQ